tara:strand:- start:356 stop:1102 length:747 start_codon:yes stop_codon:yes gene_type:complete
MTIKRFSKVATLLGATVLTTSLFAQDDMMESPRDAAPIGLDRLEGQWMAYVNEDWLWRMRVAEKGDFTSIPYNDLAEQVGQAWEEDMVGSCLQYGAAGVMRQPLRIRVNWESDDVLTIETDYGQQTRRFLFNEEPPPASAPHSLQGYSVAEWEYDAAPAMGQEGQYGSLKVETSHLTAAWLRSNGAPVSENATLTEYYDVFEDPTGQEWLVATVIVHDPTYLRTDFVTSSHFIREEAPGGWDPRPCGM